MCRSTTLAANPASILGRLQGEILTWNNNIGNPVLPDTTTTETRFDNLNGVGPTLQVVAGDYIVEHYDVGPNGVPGTGGGLVAYFVVADQSYTLPDNGPGPNGTGGISFVDIWDHGSVPDGGMTLSLLGIGLAAVETLRRKLGSS